MSKRRPTEWEARARFNLARARSALVDADALFEDGHHITAARRLMRAGAATTNALKAIESRPTPVARRERPLAKTRSWGFRVKRAGWVLRIHLIHYKVLTTPQDPGNRPPSPAEAAVS
ncbi:MAG: hypothetical protein QOK05_600 [Chloroflexota bacterium]|jgi:hypothetical protein|nr:hypothetical protein [Chloroflexota bacterium]